MNYDSCIVYMRSDDSSYGSFASNDIDIDDEDDDENLSCYESREDIVDEIINEIDQANQFAVHKANILPHYIKVCLKKQPREIVIEIGEVSVENNVEESQQKKEEEEEAGKEENINETVNVENVDKAERDADNEMRDDENAENISQPTTKNVQESENKEKEANFNEISENTSQPNTTNTNIADENVEETENKENEANFNEIAENTSTNTHIADENVEETDNRENEANFNEIAENTSQPTTTNTNIAVENIEETENKENDANFNEIAENTSTNTNITDENVEETDNRENEANFDEINEEFNEIVEEELENNRIIDNQAIDTQSQPTALLQMQNKSSIFDMFLESQQMLTADEYIALKMANKFNRNVIEEKLGNEIDIQSQPTPLEEGENQMFFESTEQMITADEDIAEEETNKLHKNAIENNVSENVKQSQPTVLEEAKNRMCLESTEQMKIAEKNAQRVTNNNNIENNGIETQPTAFAAFNTFLESHRSTTAEEYRKNKKMKNNRREKNVKRPSRNALEALNTFLQSHRTVTTEEYNAQRHLLLKPKQQMNNEKVKIRKQNVVIDKQVNNRKKRERPKKEDRIRTKTNAMRENVPLVPTLVPVEGIEEVKQKVEEDKRKRKNVKKALAVTVNNEETLKNGSLFSPKVKRRKLFSLIEWNDNSMNASF